MRQATNPILTLAMLLTLAVAAMDMTTLVAVLPKAVGEFGGIDAYSWPTSIHLFLMVLAVPAYGWLGRHIGLAPLLLVALPLTVFGGHLAATAPTFWVLIVARMIQGLGGAALWTVPIVWAAQACRTSPHTRGWLVWALWAILGLVGPLAGILGLPVASWRGMFQVYVVVGSALWLLIAVGCLIGRRSGSVSVRESAETALSLPGLLGALAALPAVLLQVGAGFSGTEAGTLPAWRGRIPALVTAIVFGAASLAMLVFLPLAVLAFWPEATWLVAMALIAFLLGQWGILALLGSLPVSAGRTVVRVGMGSALLAVIVLLANYRPGIAPAVMLGCALLYGLGAGLIQRGLVLASMAHADPIHHGRITAVLDGARLVSGTLGTGMVGTVLANVMAFLGPSSARVHQVLSSVSVADMAPDKVQTLSALLISGTAGVYWAVLFLTVLAGLISLALPAAHPRTVAAPVGTTV